MTDTITALHRNLCDAAQELTRAHAAALHEHGRDYDPARVAQPTAALASALAAWQRAAASSAPVMWCSRCSAMRPSADGHACSTCGDSHTSIARIVDDVPRDADGAPVEHEVIAGMC